MASRMTFHADGTTTIEDIPDEEILADAKEREKRHADKVLDAAELIRTEQMRAGKIYLDFVTAIGVGKVEKDIEAFVDASVTDIETVKTALKAIMVVLSCRLLKRQQGNPFSAP